MNRFQDIAFQEYMKGNSVPLIQVVREKLKNETVLCDFVVLIIQNKVRLKPGPKAGKYENRDRQLAARVEELMRTEPYWHALEDAAEKFGLSGRTAARAYSKYVAGRKSRRRS